VTTNAGGASQKWLTGYTRVLTGRDVVIIPDNDPAGEQHAQKIAAALIGKTQSIRIVRLPGLPEKGDVSDWLDAGGTVEELRGLMSNMDIEPSDICQNSDEGSPAPEIPTNRIVNAIVEHLGEGQKEITPLPMRKILQSVNTITAGWPRRIGDALFVDVAGSICWLNSTDALIGWLGNSTGHPPEFIRSAKCHTPAHVYHELRRTAQAYQAVETLPDPDGAGSGVAPETVYVYDSAGNLLSESNQLGETTTYTYDRLDRLTTTTDPRSYDTEYTYDILGRQTSLTDAEGNQTTFLYDDLDRLRYETNELGKTRSYGYDLLGRLDALVDRNGRLTRFYYDNLDRLKLEVWWTGWGGSFVDSLTTTYNDAGLVASHTDNSGTFSYDYTYDDLDRLVERTEAGSPSITWTYTYDKAGNLIKREDTAGFTNNYYRDDLGRIVTLTQVLSGGGKKVAYEYNKLGQVTKLTRYEDLAGTIVNSFTETFYDDAHRIETIRHRNAPGALLRRYIYTYDSASRLVRIDDLSGAYETHEYDDAGQLIESFYSYQTNENYSYDGTGNRTNTGYVTGDNNQTTDDGTYTYQYDDEGNRTRKTTKSTGAYVEYQWDHRNRLTRVEFRTSGGTLTKAVEYDYDHADRRVAKRVDVNADSTWDDQERFVYDGEDVMMVYDETGTPELEGRYLHGPGIDTVLAYWQPGVPKIRWTFTDRLGSVRDVVDSTAAAGEQRLQRLVQTSHRDRIRLKSVHQWGGENF
jgi:YD repeat-containing protein